jgi:hypothetical protein
MPGRSRGVEHTPAPSAGRQRDGPDPLPRESGPSRWSFVRLFWGNVFQVDDSLIFVRDQFWLRLSSVRDEAALARFPAAGRDRWRQSWSEARAFAVSPADPG